MTFEKRLLDAHQRKIEALEGGIRLLNRFTLGLAFLTLTIGIVAFAAYLRG